MQESEGAARELADRLAAEGVRFVRVGFADLHGKARGKELPVAELPLAAHGLGFCVASMMEELTGVPIMEPGFAGEAGFPDMRVAADLTTARRLPWDPDTAWLLADLHDADGPLAIAPRAVLRRAVEAYEARGLAPVVGPELEFYLVAPDGPDGRRRYTNEPAMAYTVGRRSDPAGAFRRLHGALVELGIGVTAANHEFSPGQFEINLRHGPALDAADRSFLFKAAVKELAAHEGLLATFMARPFEDGEGNGLHVHLSLDRHAGGPALAGDGEDGLSTVARRLVAGVLAHAPALAAFGSPTVNSYKRLVPGGLAPQVANWGLDNRSALVRVPPDRGSATRLEVRGADASANPYLYTAALLLAGLDGLERELEPPAPTVGLTPADAGLPPLPRSLDAALEALTADAWLTERLGSELVRVFTALKRLELERFRLAVTDWEWREYAFHL